MIKTVINETDVNKADIVLVSAGYEKTASSHKGTVNGPKKVVESLDHLLEFFDRKFKVDAIDFIKTAHQNLENLDNLSPEETLENIKKECQKLLNANKFIFLLGGEHSVSIGLFQALAEKYDPKDLTILQIDAHCDLRKDDSDYSEHPSPFSHGTVMRHASEIGYPLVQVGIRTYSKEEYEFFSDAKNNITVFEWGNNKKVPSIEEILNSIKTKYIYISIDVDGFDPAHMPGTGTPVQGGLEWWYGMELIEKAIHKYELVSGDIVEVSPIPDSALTEYGAAQLTYSIISNKFRDKFKS